MMPLTYDHECCRNEERQDISAIRLAVLSVSFGEEDQSGVDSVHPQGLNEPWNGQEIGQGRTQCGCKASRIYQWPPGAE